MANIANEDEENIPSSSYYVAKLLLFKLYLSIFTPKFLVRKVFCVTILLFKIF
jgi:hypothetical protein